MGNRISAPRLLKLTPLDSHMAGINNKFRDAQFSWHKVIGILDWELSTLGNHMCDVAYSTLHYAVDIDLDKLQQYEGIKGIGFPEGIPSLPEYLANYCSASGKPWHVADWKFYVIFSMFRGASIYAGVHSIWMMELDKTISECLRLQERSIALAQELVALKL